MHRSTPRLRSRFTLAVAAAALLVVAAAPLVVAKPPPGSPAEQKATTTQVQILGLNDFHGNLEPPSGSGGRIGALNSAGQCVAPACFLAGGVEYLATTVRELRSTNPNTLFVSAGDLIGATPLISALFHDEPSIEAFNLMDLDFNGVGNHEFDEGVDELLRMQNGGCHPVDGCADGDPYNGADFQFLAANVAYKDSGDTIFPPYAIRSFEGGIKVGIIGMTLEGTPDIVTPAGIQTVDFFDEAETVNALVPVLKKQGVETIVVLLHEGGNIGAPGNGAGSVAAINSCNNPTGALPPIVAAMDDEVDVVVTGHTNWAINCEIDGKIVTGAAAFGRLVTDIDLTISRATKDVVSATVNNEIVERITPAADLTALVNKYRTAVAPLSNRVIGSITADILRANNAAGESALGDVIADAQLAATSGGLFGSAVVAFMNPGGIRADFNFAQISGSEAPGQVTYGEAFTVQPFSNVMTVQTCTGQQIHDLLEQQWGTNSDGSARQVILQVSTGFTYTWDGAAPNGDRVDATDILLGGTPIDLGADYQVAMNNFLATGGDGFSIFTTCTDPIGGEIDLDALVAYFEDNSPIAPGPQNRITRLN
jgi:5'-nucleotidase